jgi:hypothetical protein
MPTTDDSKDPRLTHGPDTEPVPQSEVYLVLSEEERAKGFVKPLRRSYIHRACGVVTTMSLALCETYARDPHFYGNTYCCGCSKHLPISDFYWVEDGATLGT